MIWVDLCRSKHSASDSMYDLPNLTKPLLASGASSRRQSACDTASGPVQQQVCCGVLAGMSPMVPMLRFKCLGCEVRQSTLTRKGVAMRSMSADLMWRLGTACCCLAASAAGQSHVLHHVTSHRLLLTEGAMRDTDFSASFLMPLQRLKTKDEAAAEYSGAPIPHNEDARYGQLCALNVLNTEADPRFDDITNLVRTCLHQLLILLSRGVIYDNEPGGVVFPP